MTPVSFAQCNVKGTWAIGQLGLEKGPMGAEVLGTSAGGQLVPRARGRPIGPES